MSHNCIRKSSPCKQVISEYKTSIPGVSWFNWKELGKNPAVTYFLYTWSSLTTLQGGYTLTAIYK